jgi:integrase/recombinase XerD
MVQELLSLQIQDVLFSENELRIHDGKGRKARRVPFQKTCANVLKVYIRERGESVMIFRSNIENLVR